MSSSLYSSHGTIDAFLEDAKCQICSQTPTSAEAVEIDQQFVCEGHTLYTVHQTIWAKCQRYVSNLGDEKILML